jgi:hypothetical protein
LPQAICDDRRYKGLFFPKVRVDAAGGYAGARHDAVDARSGRAMPSNVQRGTPQDALACFATMLRRIRHFLL